MEELLVEEKSSPAAEPARSQTIRSIEKALDIIEFLYRNGEEASLHEISQATGLFGSTTHRILTTLKLRGYIHQNSKNSKYWLGSKFYGIGNSIRENMPLADLVEPYAAAVAKKYMQTVYTAVPYYQSSIAQQMIVSKVSFSPFILKEPEVGSISFSHGAATGKCMMAYYPEKLINEYKNHPLPMMTSKTITDWRVLSEELSRIRHNGYAMESDEEEVGITCIAVPVMDSQQNMIASISLSGPTSQIFEHKFNDILADLWWIAQKVSAHF